MLSAGGSRPPTESSILFSFETDFSRRVKARPADRNFGRERSAAGLHASRDSFYRTARGERQHRPGVIPLDLLPRRCPVCRDDTIIGHGRRLRQCHDDQHERIWVRRGICRAVQEDLHDLARLAGAIRHTTACIADSRLVSGSPPAILPSKPRRTAKIRRACPIHPPCADGRSVDCSACGAGSRPEPSKSSTFCGHPPSLPGIWARSAVFCRIEARSP